MKRVGRAPAPSGVKGVQRKQKATPRLNKGTLRAALVTNIKAQSGRSDMNFKRPSSVAVKTQELVPIEQRAGYPVKRLPGSVDPKDWVTFSGDKIVVDLGRAKWLPDEWGQGVKMTHKNGRSAGKKDWGGRGTLTTYVAPDGKSFFHQHTSEQYAGKKFTVAGGINGQIRLAQRQAEQAVQLARAQIREGQGGRSCGTIGVDPDSALFKVLSGHERRYLASKDDFHFCVISARRATKPQGVSDIMMVQMQLQEAGVVPTWYVDKESVKDYRALGLKVLIGGKLTEARNKALSDARRQGKVCVQLSDDISAWEYRHGADAKDRSDDAQNAAHAAAQRIIVSPVAAARFILAKMRGSSHPAPKLGGVYMLGSCARTFAGEAFSRQHFILGDFFVADGGTTKFDERMTLKEDYDFTCSHIKAHGSVMRCNRLTLNVKHYANAGGAVTNRDKKGAEERRNIATLFRKWPGVFRPNPKRRNEVIMRWKKEEGDDLEDEDAVDDVDREHRRTVGTSCGRARLKVRKTVLKKRGGR